MHRERPGGGDRAGVSGAEGKAAAGGVGRKGGGVEFADHLAAESDFGGPADELVGRSGLHVIPSGARNLSLAQTREERFLIPQTPFGMTNKGFPATSSSAVTQIFH